MRTFTSAIAAVALLAALYVGIRPVGPIPPLGALLDPRSGIWAVASTAELPAEQELALPGAAAPVEVRYDDRAVPHIFATSTTDAARALGWVHARDRLFQMELVQRAVAGDLTQLVGERALPLDRSARRLRMAHAANAKWDAVADATTRAEVEAYMEGVNAYIDGMRPQDLPLEYRLLGRQPRRFEPRDTYYLLMRMSQTLSYQESELRFHALAELIGQEAASALLAIDAPIQEPIEPVRGRSAPRFATRPIPDPRAPDAAQVAEARRTRDAVVQLARVTRLPFAASQTELNDLTDLLTRGEAVVGSNNWAVGPGRSASGYAMLAGDPHLELTLPSIWYEAHLVVPGELDVYGVTIPLAPIVPIGFNRDVAWTMTNTGNDVVDYYRETVDDTLRPRKYLVDGEWRDLEIREELFQRGDGTTIARDTMYATHRGPLLETSLGWMSQRWTARDPSDEGSAFRSAMRATSSADFYARTAGYRTPAQNMLTADRSGNIGIRSTGRYPIRPGSGRGDLIFDGSASASDWIGDRPLEWYPQAYNPAQGYLASANQQPVDPSVRSGYAGSDWPSPWRAMRINSILRANPRVTPEDLRRAHTDPRSELTPFVVSALRDAISAAEAAGDWSAEDRRAWQVLTDWNTEFTPDASGAVLFESLLSALTRLTWDELVLPNETRRVATPGQMMLVQLMRQPRSKWWDRLETTGEVETRDAVLLAALRDAWAQTTARHGQDPSAWRWGDVRKVQINHLLRLPGFNWEGLSVTSGPGTLSPSESGGTHGASWRFVVELAPEIRAWGTFPGGQSGNPVSPRYSDRIALWQRGELAELRVPHSADALQPAQTSARLHFVPVVREAR
ncbi:MAG: penicillin acylase family protein [Gemmatimonadaceae bacterium]|nr:penicillin acylase family protein [Gemmatimonadaceae bacterium]